MEIDMYKAIAGAAIAIALFSVSSTANAVPDVCVQSGCWVWKCSNTGASCGYVFVAKDPFEKDTRQEK
ncbi:MAG: hypothetical protein B7X39_14305 [Lysobacterales bacterium 14-68-21]|jgi:hypothetical protein|uniref:hypothetical protein n=1 Tax=Stenotrophomonas acidaminiphila TaxID=128780 RepID=UPI000BD624A9|nr:hypothetical protein [Stenotrophomonas acidaminiphila]OZB64951.1 MAG: hypothetical protein B7X39_14305 [Xanthomonadales bacterium 14-68-21]